MNAVHDLGGMHGFGALPLEPDEPLFHDDWERRAFALTLAMGATGQWNIDRSRAARESLPPLDYLQGPYYRIWFDALCRLLVERGLATPQEIASGCVDRPPRALARVLRADAVAAALAAGSPTERPATQPARFAEGDAVRARNFHPGSHTRLPRYARGRRGRVVALRGVHVFADAHARGEGEQPQWLYTVRFDAHELWGPDTTADCVHVDCWESYLERAESGSDDANAAR